MQLLYLKELAREISDLSHEDFSLLQTAVQSHPSGSTQAHAFELTAAASDGTGATSDGTGASSNTSDGTGASSNSSSRAMATETSGSSLTIAAAAQLREFLDRLRQEVYYSDSGAVSDLDGSVCDEGRGSSLVCADTDTACSAIPSATNDTATEREAVESLERDSKLDRDASGGRPKISQDQSEACQQIPEPATEKATSEDSTGSRRSDGKQESSQADTDLFALEICGFHTAEARPNRKGVVPNRQRLGDPSLGEERKAVSSSHSSWQKARRSRRQSKGRRGRRRAQHQGVHPEDWSTVSHCDSLPGLQHDPKPGNNVDNERKDSAIPAMATREPSTHCWHRPGATGSAAAQVCTGRENTQAQFNTAFNYQEVVQFLRKGKQFIILLLYMYGCGTWKLALNDQILVSLQSG